MNQNWYFVLLFVLVCVADVYNKQTKYTFVHEYGKVTYSDPNVVNVHATFFKINRTSGALNVTATLLHELDRTATITIQAYQFYNNGFREAPIQFTLNICDLINNQEPMFDIPHILECTNVTTCPMPAGTYYVNNVVPDASQFPPFIPAGKYKIQLHFALNNKTAAILDWIAKVEYVDKQT